MKIVFFGTPFFAVEVLKELLSQQIDVIAIVTKPEQPQGRALKLKPSPVKQFVSEMNIDIPVYEPLKASESTFIQLLNEMAPDFFVVVGYGEILKQELLNVPKIAPINIHTSLLPAYRGAAPIQRAMMAGEKEMGITVMKMNAKMDAGEILIQKATHVDFNKTFLEVELVLIELAKQAIIEVLRNYQKWVFKAQLQDLSLVSHAPKIGPEDLLIDPSQSIFLIQRKVMALSPKPAAYCIVLIAYQERRIKILEAELSDQDVEFGKLVAQNQNIFLGCSNGALKVNKLQLEGKSIVSSRDFLNGHTSFFPIQLKF